MSERMDESVSQIETAPREIKHRGTFITMLVSSIASLTASLVLSIDAIALAKNPNSSLACNINAVISCGKVGVSWQSNLLGFPNAFLGLICEPVVITLAVAGLVGVRFPKTFMRIATSVYFIGLLFAFWLFTQSYFVIGAFCPWCLLVTFTTTTVFSSMLKVNALEGNLPFSARLNEKIVLGVSKGWDNVIVGAVLTALALAIMLKYGNQIF